MKFINRMTLDFNSEIKVNLKSIVIELQELLSSINIFHFNDQLSQILVAVENEDESSFRNLIESKELFGGAGALWELWIEEENYRKKFHQYFTKFLQSIEDIGIRNRRIKQIKNDFIKMQ